MLTAASTATYTPAQNAPRPTASTKVTTLLKGLLTGIFWACTAYSAPVTANITPNTLVKLENSPFKASYVVPAPQAPNTIIHLTINQGEAALLSPEGMPHYLEHLTVLSAIEPKTKLTGYRSNATTNQRTIDYWVKGPKSALEQNLKVLTGIFDPIALSDKTAIQERGVVLQEYNLRALNNEELRIHERINQQLHSNTLLARSIIGSPKTISTLSPQKAQQLHTASHIASNATLLVYGNVSVKDVKKALAGLPLTQDKKAGTKATPYQMNKEQRIDLEHSSETTEAASLHYYKAIQLRGPLDSATLKARLTLLVHTLNSSLPGSLGETLYYEEFLAESYRFSLRAIDQRHLSFQFIANPDEGISTQELHDSFESTLRQASEGGIKEETWERVKRRLINKLENDEDSAFTTYKHAKEMITQGLSPYDAQQYHQALQNTQPHHLNNLLRAFINSGRAVTLTTIPANTKD